MSKENSTLDSEKAVQSTASESTVSESKAVQSVVTDSEKAVYMQSKIKWTPQQLSAINLRGKNIIVSASAGSGKTSVMIERVAGLIAEGYNLSDMLVVTFTRAAASDIKDKLARRLSTSDDPHIRSQLKQISDADIGTLHSWCQRLTGRYFYQTGLDPDFSVLEDDRAGLFEGCMDKVIDAEYAAGDNDFFQLLEILGGRDETALKSALSDFYNHLYMRPDFDIATTDENAREQLLQILEARQQRLLRAARQLRQDTYAADFVRNAAAADELVDAVQNATAPLSSPRGKIPAEHIQLNDRYKKIKECAKAFACDMCEAMCAPPADSKYLQVLLRMAKQLSAEFLQCKKSRSKADFGDLEHYALGILQSEAGEEIKRAYKFIFVDEYQDINPLQNAIVDKLCSGNNLFLVGDLKQSIYAFRGCEPTIFLQKIQDFSADPQSEVIELNANHRSERGVLEFVNKVFCRTMTQDFGGTDYALTGKFVLGNKDGKDADSNQNCDQKQNPNQDSAQDSNQNCDQKQNPNQESNQDSAQESNKTHNQGNAKNTGIGGNCVGMYLYENKKQAKTGVYNLAADSDDGDIRADLVAARILQLLREKVTHDGASRDARFGDIAVLFRSGGTGVFSLIKKLERLGIPVAVAGGLCPQSGKEISALVGYLRLIDNRADDAALIGALKSRFGGFSDGELAEIRLAFPAEETFAAAALLYADKTETDKTANKIKIDKTKTKGETENNTESGSLAQKLSEFFAILDGYRRLSCTVSTEELIGRIVTDFNYFQHMFLRGGTAAEQLEAFLDFAAGKTDCLSEFLQSLPKKFSAQAAAEDAVLIMTVHSAKGLEFPFVIIPDAQKRFNISDLKQPIIVFGQLAAIKHFDWEKRESVPTAGWLLNKYSLHRRQREEEMRLLYVGLTRAKQSVDIFAECGGFDDESLQGDFTGDFSDDFTGDFTQAEDCDCWLKWLLPFAKKHLRTITPAGELPKKTAIFPPPDPQLLELLSDGINHRIPACDLPPKTYVTALLDGEENRIVIQGGEHDDRAMLIGTLYHKAMELIDFDKDFDAEWGKLDDSITQMVDKESIRRACQSTARLLAGCKIYKEQGFMLDLSAEEAGFSGQGSVLVQGVIDALAIKDGKAVVVDYKTGGISSKYKKQLQLYALAVRRILGISEVKMLIYSFALHDFLDADLL